MCRSRLILTVLVFAGLGSATALPMACGDPADAALPENSLQTENARLAARVQALEDRLARVEKRLSGQPGVVAPFVTGALPGYLTVPPVAPPARRPDAEPENKYRARIILLGGSGSAAAQ